MSNKSNSSFIIIGLALFSMFFGSGNLIYPLFVGQAVQDLWVPATLGFLLMAVAMPFSGVIAMVLFKGDYTRFFSVIGKGPGLLLTALLLTVWIPLGSAPRCITLAYASVSNYFDLPAVWIVSPFYCLLLYLVTFKSGRVLDVLGRVLTPVLLFCLAAVIYYGVQSASSLSHSSFNWGSSFFLGLSEGYNTMDLIASFFFSVSIMAILKKSKVEEGKAAQQVLKSGVVAMSLLVLVYVGLIFLTAANADSLVGIPKDRLLVHLTKEILPPAMGFLALFAVVLACFTTSIALVLVYADFLKDTVFRSGMNKSWAIPATLVITYVMSIFGLEGITFVTAPLLSCFYPTLIVLIVFNIGKMMLSGSKVAVAS